MTEPTFFTESLDHWRGIRRGTIAEVENIPESDFDFRPNPEVRSVRELLHHILEGSMMTVGELTRDEPSFRRMSFAEFMDLYGPPARVAQTKQELIDQLERQVEQGVQQFTRVGEDAMMGPVTNFDGSVWTRLQWLFHAMTEEMYHRGQLTTYTRLLGLVPALTQRIKASSG